MGRILAEVAIIAIAALVYFFVRGLMETQHAIAFANAEWLIAFEQRFGLFHEPAMQSWLLDHEALVMLANRFYIFGHWPVIAGTMVWLLWKHHASFGLYRNALLLSGAVGIVLFVLVPMAPPRFLVEYGFVDTVMERSEAYRVLQPPSFTNPYAAMPSLHVGWNLLMGIAILRQAQSLPVRLFAWLMPVAMWIATIVTANHFIVDGVVGSLVAVTGLGIAWWARRPWIARGRP